ncbi:hypothetical protein REPUB_Repub10bG0157100 [Reevesia pubescens]
MCQSKADGGLGFRSMEKFNKAMLCKQGWRLLTETKTLAYHVLKAKYFPDTNFLNSKLGSHPSLTWRSIWGTKRLLERGTRWRVGNGSNIRVWQDKWLPTKEPFILQTPHSLSQADWRVEVLIDKDSMTWKKEMIHNIFPREDADTFCSIPLCTTGGNDILVWHYDRKGQYTVRSGYRLLCSSTPGNNVSLASASSPAGKRVSELLWRANVPPKLRVFAWKAVNDILPTFDNLSKRNIDVDRQCSRCFGHNETALHVLRDCAFADGVWKLRNLSWARDGSEPDNILTWMHTAVDTADQDMLQRFMAQIWALWKARNDFTHGEPSRSMIEVSCYADRFIQEFNEAQLSQTRHIPSAAQRWVPPPEGKFKINFDGSFHPANREGGIGIVIRDFRGRVAGATAQTILNAADPFTVEAMGAVRALEFARFLGLTSVILEGDALCITRKLSSTEQDFSPIGPLIDEARSLMKHFAICAVSHTPRAYNMVAHHLSRYSMFIHHDMYWLDECPGFVHSFVINDLISYQ